VYEAARSLVGVILVVVVSLVTLLARFVLPL
jgi:hypothetical protein